MNGLLLAAGLVLVVVAHRSVGAPSPASSAAPGAGVTPATPAPTAEEAHAAAVLRYGRAERAVLYYNQAQRVARVAAARYQDDHEHSLARLGDLFVDFVSIAGAPASAVKLTDELSKTIGQAVDQADDRTLKTALAGAADLAKIAVAEAKAAGVQTLEQAQDVLKAMSAQYGASIEKEWLKLAPGVPVAKG